MPLDMKTTEAQRLQPQIQAPKGRFPYSVLFIEAEVPGVGNVQTVQAHKRFFGNIDGLLARERAKLGNLGGANTPSSGPSGDGDNGNNSGLCAGGCGGCAGGCGGVQQ